MVKIKDFNLYYFGEMIKTKNDDYMIYLRGVKPCIGGFTGFYLGDFNHDFIKRIDFMLREISHSDIAKLDRNTLVYIDSKNKKIYALK